MLVVTENARQVIESIVADAEMPDGSGIRIDAPEQPPTTSDRTAVPLQLQVASEPSEDDQVVGEGGGKVFVAPAAAPVLDDKVLDVRVSEDQMQFVIGPQQDQPGAPG
jgi:Fe-S cluster assembly iron-binding protein IscA